VEIGNYDSFYDQGVVFSPEKVSINSLYDHEKVFSSVIIDFWG
jgi:hypothetical protein